MNKIISTILAALLVFLGANVPAAHSTTEPEITDVLVSTSGIIMEADENGLLILQNDGTEVYVHISADTVIEVENLAVGAYANVDYNGMMTRSLPPQISALRVYGAVVEGIITEIMDGCFLLSTETHGDIIVNFPADMSITVAGEHVRVYFDGAMTMSLPAQIGAQFIETIPNENARTIK